MRAEVIGTTGGTLDVGLEVDPSVTVVAVRGPLEQRATMHDHCGGWTDGHDAIAERLCAALCDGDVVLVIDSPGGAHAGLQEAIRRVQKCKADYGRRITAYADEMIGSAAYWWAATVADEIYLPEAGIVGSIGARSSHCSEAGHLAQEGVEVTYFAAPGVGKVAFAPELPLSDIGKQRGERDVWIAFDAFAAAVGASRGISRQDLVELDADALTGQAAVDAGLADGVASLDDVLAYALAMAGGEGVAESSDYEAAAPTGNNASGAKAARRVSMAQPESPEKAKNLDEKAKKMAEKKMLESLAAKYANEMAEKHAEKMAEAEDEESNDDADSDSDDGGDGGGGDGGGGGGGDDADMAEVEDEAEEEDEEQGPPSSKPMPPPRRMQPPPAKQDKSVAALFGLRASASAPAVKAAALPYVALANAAMGLTGARSPREAEGALRALADDAADAVKLRAELKAVKAREARRERLDLLRKLAAANLPGYTRGDLFVDVEHEGKLVPVPAPMYDEMKLSTLRGLVNGKLKNAPATKAAPFQPSQAAAQSASSQATVDIVAPQAAQFAGRSTANADKLAAAAAALMQMGAFSNG